MLSFRVQLQNGAGMAFSKQRILSKLTISIRAVWGVNNNIAGTYDLQSVRVKDSDMVSGTFYVNLQYIMDSPAQGSLLTLHQGQHTGYFAVRKPSGMDSQSVVLEGLPRGEYVIRGYDARAKWQPCS